MACIVLLYKVYCVCTYVCICVCGCVYLLWLRKWIHWPELPFRHTKNGMYCNTKTCVLLFEGFNLWLDGRRTLPPWNHGDNNQTRRRVEDSKKQHKLKAIDISLSMSLSFSLFLPVCPQCVSSLLSWRLLSSSVIKAFTIQTTDPLARAKQSTRALRAPLHLLFTLSLYFHVHFILACDIFTRLTV